MSEYRPHVVTIEIVAWGESKAQAEGYVLDALERTQPETGLTDWQSTRVADDWSQDAKALDPTPISEWK